MGKDTGNRGRVDFYVLAGGDSAGRMGFACKLAEKAYRMSLRVHAAVDGRHDAEYLDRLLWTFRQGSFVPHEIISDAGPGSPVTIGIGNDREIGADLLINLRGAIWENDAGIERIAEIVGPAAEEISAGRQRYRDYRDRGFAINTHNLGGGHD